MHRPLPLVGISATQQHTNGRLRVRTDQAYVAAAAGAGLLPVLLAPLPPEHALHVLQRLDGLILSGGEDVDPALYGAERHPNLRATNRERDEWEIALVHAAQRTGLPLLAICRGVQVLNVALGGTLVQDIPSQVPDALDHDRNRDHRAHPIAIEPGSRLAEIVGCAIEVNTSHHQSAAELGEGLRVVAQAPDGVVEALEWPGDWWAVGVQWHPETLQHTAESWDRDIFHAFAAAASDYRASKTPTRANELA